MEHKPTATIAPLAHGLLADCSNTDLPSRVYGITQFDPPVRIRECGTAFGYVHKGYLTIIADQEPMHVAEGSYFSAPARRGVSVLGGGHQNRPGAPQAFFAWRMGYYGLRSSGGPVEQVGRLKYIDGCSDTLLIAPPLKGEPCFNYLHFPVGITQTKHTHPSIRAGFIHGGAGKCVTDEGESDLLPGHVFVLQPNAVHAFCTPRSYMDLTVFHPDSDFGPTHEDHPMLNRTIVEGVSAKNIDAIRTKELRT